MSHVRYSFGAVVVTEFGSGFLAGVHSGDSSATRVMGCPLGDVVNFSRDDDPAIVSIVVPGDFFARDREMANVMPGDFVALCTAGAYGFVQSSNYNSRPRPAEVLVEGGVWKFVRSRETFEDLIRGE